MTPTPKFQNGDTVRDVVTNLEGMVIATTLWLNGCYRYVVQSRTINKETGKVTENEAFDEHQLVLVESAVFTKETQKQPRHETGGPRPNPTRQVFKR